MKISLITAARNAEKTIRDTMESVARQRLDLPVDATPSSRQVGSHGFALEYIIVDGASTDGTALAIREFERRVKSAPSRADGFSLRWTSEPDRGLYDAINKGIRLATGDVVGICNADDVLASDDALAKVAGAFLDEPELEAVYGDVRFVRDGASVEALRAAPTVRYCTGRFFRPWMFRFATFPAHPATFVRRDCFAKCGDYSLDYPICADFEMMLRLFVVHQIRARYLPLCTTVMRVGGLSTGAWRKNVQINREDLRALRAHGVRSCLPLIYLKYVFKVFGLLRRGSPCSPD